MHISTGGRRAWLATAVVVCVWAAGDSGASTTPQPTLVTITIDGKFTDWKQVLLNPLQVSNDGNGTNDGVATCYPANPDRDCPLTSTHEDIITFAWTYDATNVYTYVSRQASNASEMFYHFVMDLGADGYANASDKVLSVDWKGGSATLNSLSVYPYLPAATDGGGDPMACPNQAACPAPGQVGYVDGYPLPGSVNSKTALWTVANVPGADSNGAGDKFEAYVPWSVLGVDAGTPIFWHVVGSTNAGTLHGAGQDNVGGPDGKMGGFGVYAMSFTPNYSGATSSPGTINYCHSLSNIGNFPDVYDLTGVSSTNSGIAFYTDDGSCGPGTLMALDSNGNGKFTDPGDIPPPAAWDSNGNGVPDLGSMAGGATKNVVLQLRVPSGLTGARDTLTGTATSAAKPTSVVASVVDTTNIGAVTVTPNFVNSGTPGLVVPIGAHIVQNNGVTSDNFNLTVQSTQPWSLSLYSDNGGAPGTLLATAGNGSTWNGSTPSTGTLASGASTRYWLEVTFPNGTAVGTLDTITLTATSQTLSTTTGSATDRLTCRTPLTIVPSYVAPSTALIGNAGSAVYLPHTIINSQAQTDTLTLSSAVTLNAGYSIKWWTDPNCDGNPSDGVQISGAILDPYGGTVCIVTEIDIPATGAGTGTSAATRATGSLAGATAQAEDDVLVGNLETFLDQACTIASRDFPACATVYARVAGLTPLTTTTYQVDYLFPDGGVADAGNIATDPFGVGYGSYALNAASPTGNWSVKLTQGATQLSSVSPVLVENAGSAALTVPAQAQSGQSLPVSAALTNSSTGANYADTSVAFVVKDPSGNVFLTDTVTGVNVAQGAIGTASTGWANVSYPSGGTYTVTATWLNACGGTIAVATAPLPVVPDPPTLTSPADGSSVATVTPALQGTATAGGTVTIYIDGASAGTVTTAANGTFSFTAPIQTQGSHSWYATQTVNGQTSAASATFTFIVNTLAPSSAITIPTQGALYDGGSLPAQAQGTANSAGGIVASVQVSIDGGPWANATGTTSWTFPLALPTDGLYQIQSKAKDTLGNTETPGPGITFTVDRAAPVTTVGFPSSGAYLNASAIPIALQGTANDAVSGVLQVELSIDGGAWMTTTGTTSWALSFTPPADGLYTIQTRGTDNALNVEAPGAGTSFTVDTMPPVSTILSPLTGSAFDGGTPVIPIAGAANDATSPVARVELSTDGITWSAASGTASWSFGFAPPADGLYVLESRATDLAGNVETPQPGIEIAYDSTPPSSAITAPAAGSLFDAGSLPIQLQGTSSDQTSGVLEVDLDYASGTWSSGWVPASGTTSWSNAFAPPQDGLYMVWSRATDQVLNVEAPGPGLAFTYDSTPPVSQITTPANGSVFDPTMLPISIQGTANDATSGVLQVEVSINDGGWLLASGTTGWSYGFTPSTPGTYQIASRATDNALNVEVPSASLTLVFVGLDGGSDGGPTCQSVGAACVATPDCCPGLICNAGVCEVQPADAGSGDAGSTSDAGSANDAGSGADAGSADSGSSSDAGIAVDAGVADAGAADSGSSSDAGSASDSGTVFTDAGGPGADAGEVGDGGANLDYRGGGCGCGATSGSPWLFAWVGLLWVFARRARRPS